MYRQFFGKELRALHKKIRPMCEGVNPVLKITDAGKFLLNTTTTMAAPWIYIHPGRFRYCGLWRLWEEMFPEYDGIPYIPSGCQRCWKVVIRPKTVYQLFLLHEILKASDLPCKCGVDVRKYTSENYGGFIYADSLEQARDYYAFVKPIIAEKLGQPIADTMIVKHGCTEFDAKLPGDQWGMPDSHAKLEMFLEDMFERPVMTSTESDAIRAFKKQWWVDYANGIGDLTWKQILGEDVSLSVSCITYE